jgi:hypothetical protein
MSGWTGAPSTILKGPTGADSVVTGPTGPTGADSTVTGPTGPTGFSDPPVLASYSSDADQPIAVGGTPQVMTLNTTNFNQGTTLTGATGATGTYTHIMVNSSGNYAINYAATMQNSSATSVSANLFLKKNGALVANSGSIFTAPANLVNVQVSPQSILAINAGDHIGVYFNGGSTTVFANAAPATSNTPATPSVIINIAQIR